MENVHNMWLNEKNKTIHTSGPMCVCVHMCVSEMMSENVNSCLHWR